MGRPWLRLDAGMVEHPRIAELREGLKALDADAACWAFVVLLMGAKRNGGGEFRSEAHLKAVMGTSYRWVPRLREVGFLEGLVVRDWDQYQVDPTATARQRRHRDVTKSGRDSHANVTTDTDTDTDKTQTNNPLPPLRVSAPRGGKPVRLSDLLARVKEVEA